MEDLKEYTNTLIKQDAGLSQQIEQYIKKKEIAEEQRKNKEQAKETGVDYVEIEDEDYAEFYESLEFQKEQDKKIYQEV